jgi:hypothetical protein
MIKNDLPGRGRTWVVACALLMGLQSQSQVLSAVQLVTQDEVNADAAQVAKSPAPRFEKAFTPGAPEILVSAPAVDSPLKAPFAIRVQFQARDDATVNPASFRVYYGIFKLDITDRITQKARVTAQGIEVEQSNIPSGSHKLTLMVADSKGRVGEKALAFQVQ